MMRDAKLMGPTLSDRMLRVVFMGAQGDEGNGENIEVTDDDEMDYGEFLEIIAAFVSCLDFLYTNHCFFTRFSFSSSLLLPPVTLSDTPILDALFTIPLTMHKM
mgnify:CR=1 FL=1